MLTALLGFLGSAFFRLFVDRVLSFAEKWQNHKHEMQMLDKQIEIAAKRHEFELDRVQVVAEMREMIEIVKAIAVAQKADAERVGILWVDAWRMSIRPGIATVIFGAYFAARAYEIMNGAPALTEFDRALLASVGGYYFMDRTLARHYARNVSDTGR